MANRFGFLERNLRGVSLVSLVIIGLLAAGAWGLLQQAIDNQLSDARVVNIAGRQRMLSQRISKNAALIASSPNIAEQQRYASELSASLDTWQQSHDGLRFGDDELGLPGENTDEVEALYTQIQPNYEVMLSAGRCLVALAAGQPAPLTCLSADQTVYIDLILSNEAAFLTGMNRIVFQYDDESTNRVEDLDDLSTFIFAATVGLLLLELIFVFIPISTRLQRNIQTMTFSQQELVKRDEKLLASEQATQALNRNLAAVVDLNSRITAVLNPNQLMQDVVDLLKDRFGLYHAHIYLYDSQSGLLNLVVGSGYIGELMVDEGRTILLNNPSSIVARAGRSFQSVVINNTRSAPDFLPHPLLPNTQSEFAVALMARGQLVGVLDLQSDVRDYFTPDLIQVFEVAASQIAAALNNATLFESIQQISAHERVLGNINRSIEQAATVDDILQVTVRELGKALRVPYTAIELQLDTTALSSTDE